MLSFIAQDFMLNDFILSVFTPSGLQSVFILSIIMLNVVAPYGTFSLKIGKLSQTVLSNIYNRPR
jgi:hypothetical protein